jgi:LmbE family N-acetylglucosaminyl deacetylase
VLHLFISPHLDDVALSCGGYVRRLTNAGHRVMMVTVCTADAPPGQPLSPSAQHEHWQWQLGAQPYRRRREEDARVAAQLGAEHVHLGLLDAIYRHNGNGMPLYEGKAFMGGQVHAWDWQHLLPALVEALEPVFQSAGTDAYVFCPLTAGGHVDHVITRRAVEQVWGPRMWGPPSGALNAAQSEVQGATPIIYYEDYPYAQKDAGALAKLLGGDGDPPAWRPVLVELTPEEIEARIAAIACYASQMFAVFGDAATMPQRVREYIARTGGERYWERV